MKIFSFSSPVRLFFILGMGLLFSACSNMEVSRTDTDAPQVGKPIKPIVNKVLADVGGDLHKISTYQFAVPAMHSHTVKWAVENHKPLLLAFATPAHCTQCDDQLKLVKGFIEAFGDELCVIHIDQYADPNSYTNLGIIGDPWTFIVDKEGIVRDVRSGKIIWEEIYPLVERLVKAPAPAASPASGQKEAPVNIIQS